MHINNDSIKEILTLFREVIYLKTKINKKKKSLYKMQCHYFPKYALTSGLNR